ncbi:hypothetical protein T440DRAFT_546586 [Plenodomus tracheiphilus IPT5]|uniref:Uncharacterized protein n=1 Tax=Plenodomus tracheiphilus IPT5 TaxID=1408161 RepID=A0A6A7ANX1_9PLEO|nr:hypothetical protein T440DRAFT_546586 [Plenodomus tracheiphilus IPT5]
MSHITDSELDALFIDEEANTQGHVSTSPLTTFHLFAYLPAELRNEVYVHYMTDFHATNPLRINASGSILLPALANTCRSIRLETSGYITPYLQHKIAEGTLRIEAQILSYNPAPLQTCLCSLSTKFLIPKDTLRSWSRVTFTGPFHFNNIMVWIRGPPLDNTFFTQKPMETADLPSFKDTGMFTGSLSVLYAVDQFIYLEQNASAAWHYLATQFLENVKDLGYVSELPPLEKGKNVERVFEVIAFWHHEMRGDFGQAMKKRLSAKALKQLRANHAEMANTVFAFWMRCAAVQV